MAKKEFKLTLKKRPKRVEMLCGGSPERKRHIIEVYELLKKAGPDQGIPIEIERYNEMFDKNASNLRAILRKQGFPVRVIKDMSEGLVWIYVNQIEREKIINEEA